MNDRNIILGVFNELIRGIGINDSLNLTNYSEVTLVEIEKKVEIEKELDYSSFSLNDLLIIRNVLCEVLKQLDSFEFEIRLGNSEDDVYNLIKLIKQKIDLHYK